MAETPEARELSLVGKVEMKIALTQSDTALQSILATYLPPLLLKLASEFVNVRNKVISVCQHVNTRIKPPSIKIPVAALLKQYKDNRNALVRHFDLLYVQQGADRLSLDERTDLFPTLLHGLSTNFQDSSKNAASLFNTFLRLLHSIRLPARGTKEDLDFRDRLGLADKTDDTVFVSKWLGKLILFHNSSPNATRCPGLSTDEYNFLQMYGNLDVWKPGASGGLSLVETKVLAIKFLASGVFIDAERFLPALFASADSNSRISETGDDILKRASSAVSLEDPSLVKQLYKIYLGDRGNEGSLPSRPPLQIKILSLLCRSRLASSFVTQGMQIVQEGLAPQQSMQQSNNAQAKQGLEAVKLKGQIFAFCNWLARSSSATDISSFAPALVGQLRQFIEDQGWPRPRAEDPLSAGELSSRAYAYESIGLLAAACPKELIVEPNVDLVRWLFTSLSEESSGKEISYSIEQALSSVLGAFNERCEAPIEIALTSLLLHHVGLHPGENENSRLVRSTHISAVRFANRCLPFNSIDGRWINVLAMRGDEKRKDVVEQSQKGLHPYWYRMINPRGNNSPGEIFGVGDPDLPSFPDLVDRFFGSEAGWNISALGDSRLSNAYMAALDLCRCTLLHQALSKVKGPPVVDADWERNIDALVANDEESREGLRGFFRNQMTEDKAVSKGIRHYLLASVVGMTAQGIRDTSRAGALLLELCSLIPNGEYASLTENLGQLRKPIFSYDKTMRLRASQVFGLAASLHQCPDSSAQPILRTFDSKLDDWRAAIGSQVLEVHGALLATAYFLSRSAHRGNRRPGFDQQLARLMRSCRDILDESRDKTLLDGVFISVSQLSLFGVLRPETLPPSQKANPDRMEGDDKAINALDWEQRLNTKCKEGDEKAIDALGHLAMQFSEDDSSNSVLDNAINHLYDLHTVRQAEVQFAVGSALCCAAAGWRSRSLISALDTDGLPPQSSNRVLTLSNMLEKIFVNCKSSKPSLRQASVIWLLCLVQYCGHLPDIQSRLKDCQVAFRGFLADRDSLNQESASRGLTLVYEKGDRGLKDDLIRDLVGSFTGTNAGLSGSVSEETELFDAGSLPTGDGSVTTYKDIMSLASEVGDSSLVYRFMSLASSNAIWSSRAAFGRFGLSNILSDASVDGYLAQNPKLYPALFRYRFDPSTSVRNSMNEIWTALVKEPTTTINAHFKSIMDDLLKNILGKEWRVRQASCAAIADLVQGRPLEMYEERLTEIWSLTFKVCDDIKESVRTAAMSLARVLTGILTRQLETGESSARNAEKMLIQVLPFLLGPLGLESGAPDVQAFSRKTLLEIIKKSNGKTLRPFVPELIGRLLGLLSSIEPEMVNWLELNADKYGLTPQDLDDARLKHVRGSSMLEAIERCLDFLDEGSMTELQRHLENAIKTVIGLPSRVGCSRVLVSLATRQNYIFRPYADAFLPLARKQVFDRNNTVSSSYAAACGYIVRLASDESLLMLAQYCHKLYFDSDDERHRVISGDIVHAVSKHATDRFNSLSGEFLPLVFVAKHDAHERAGALFEDTWSETVGGSRTVLLYLTEILQLASRHLDSARWSVKHTSALAIADVVTSLGTDISDTNVSIVWPSLEKALSGKTWAGKEKVLTALITLVKHSSQLKTDKTVEEQISKILIRESKRNNPTFRQHALQCLGDFIELQESDIYDLVYPIAKSIIEELLSDVEEMDVDTPSGGPSSKSVKETTIANALKMLIISINPRAKNVNDISVCLSQTVELVVKANRSEKGNKIVQYAILDALQSLFQKLQQIGSQVLPRPLEDTLVEIAKQILSSNDQVEHVRVKAAEAAIAMAPLAKNGDGLKKGFLEGLTTARSQERSVTVQHSLDLAKKILQD